MNRDIALTKVPAVTLTFWIIKILATTLGETGGDTVTMTMDLGYLVGTAIFRHHSHCRADRAPDPGEEISSAALLGDHRRLDHRRHDARRFRDPFARHRLYRRFAAAVRLRACLAWRPGTGRKARSRSRPSTRRASSGSTGSPSPSRKRSAPRSATGSPPARRCPARRWTWLRGRRADFRRRARDHARRSISGPRFRACFCSGRRSF